MEKEYSFKTTFLFNTNRALVPSKHDTVYFLTLTEHWIATKEQSQLLRQSYNIIEPQKVPTFPGKAYYEDMDEILEYISENRLFNGKINITHTGEHLIDVNTGETKEFATLAEWKTFLLTFSVVCHKLPPPFQPFHVSISYKETPLFRIEIYSYDNISFSVYNPLRKRTYGNKLADRVSVHNLVDIDEIFKEKFKGSQEFFHEDFVNLRRVHQLLPEAVTEIKTRFLHSPELYNYNRPEIFSILLSSNTADDFHTRMKEHGYNRAVAATAIYCIFKIISLHKDFLHNALYRKESGFNVLAAYMCLKERIPHMFFGGGEISESDVPRDTFLVTTYNFLGDDYIPITKEIVYCLEIDEETKEELVFDKNALVLSLLEPQFTETAFFRTHPSIEDWIESEAYQIAMFPNTETLPERYTERRSGCYLTLEPTYALALSSIDEYQSYSFTELHKLIETYRICMIKEISVLETNSDSPQRLEQKIKYTDDSLEFNIKIDFATHLKNDIIVHKPVSASCVFSTATHIYDLYSCANNNTALVKYTGLNLMGAFVQKEEYKDSKILPLFINTTEMTPDTIDELNHARNSIIFQTEFGIDELSKLLEKLTIPDKRQHTKSKIWYHRESEKIFSLEGTNIWVFRETTLQHHDKRKIAGTWFSVSSFIESDRPNFLLLNCKHGHLHPILAKACSVHIKKNYLFRSLWSFKPIARYEKDYNKFITIETPYWLRHGNVMLEIVDERERVRVFKRPLTPQINMITLHGLQLWSNIVIKTDDLTDVQMELEVGMFMLRRNQKKTYVESTKETKKYELFLIKDTANGNYYRRYDLHGLRWMSIKDNEIVNDDKLTGKNCYLVYRVDINSKLHEHTY